MQIPEEEQLEPLVILEEGDKLDNFTHSSTRGKGILRVKTEDMDDRMKGSRVESIDSKSDVEEGESTHITIRQEEEESQKKEGLEYKNRKIEGVTETEDNQVKRVQTGPGVVMEKAGGEMEGLKTDAVPKESLADTQPSVQLRPRDRLSPESVQQKVTFYKNS